jgi:DNA-directed RNA polymerase subunit RPC12/RpoP
MAVYRCSRCGDSYNALQANGKGFDSGQVRCERIICDTCRRFPALAELPEPDADAESTPLSRFYFN